MVYIKKGIFDSYIFLYSFSAKSAIPRKKVYTCPPDFSNCSDPDLEDFVSDKTFNTNANYINFVV